MHGLTPSFMAVIQDSPAVGRVVLVSTLAVPIYSNWPAVSIILYPFFRISHKPSFPMKHFSRLNDLAESDGITVRGCPNTLKTAKIRGGCRGGRVVGVAVTEADPTSGILADQTYQ